VFQTWRGGFNNGAKVMSSEMMTLVCLERMSLEIAVALAICLGRVLVLPPKFDMYLLAPSHLGGARWPFDARQM
jgi:hypothetical protein